MASARVINVCAICDAHFESSEQTQQGLYLTFYQVNVCVGCYAKHRDGWAPDVEDRITWKLRTQGFRPPERNEKGLFPRGI